MEFVKGLKYSKTHEWVKLLEDGTALVGITDYAQSEMGDLVFINLPEVGDDMNKEEAFCDIESVKAVSDVMSPLTGAVKEINEELLDTPEKLNSDPYGAWIVKAENVSDIDDLMDEAEYEAFVNEEAK
jgi:glycine cleavage system H protein